MGEKGYDLPVHGASDNAKVRWPMLTWPIAFPDMCLIVTDFVVECVVDGDGCSGALVDPVHVVLELDGLKKNLEPRKQEESNKVYIYQYEDEKKDTHVCSMAVVVLNSLCDEQVGTAKTVKSEIC